MIPTLWGVTVVSFLIMQLAPGDPLLLKAGRMGLSGQTGQTRDAYLIQKRDLSLDKPLVLNFNYFRDYGEPVGIAAHYMARDDQEIAEEAPKLAAGDDPEVAARRRFLEGLRIPQFAERLADPQQHAALGQAIGSYVRVFCEDTGAPGVPAAMAILDSPEADMREKIGVLRALDSMVPEPFVYTYSRHPSEGETPAVLSTWRTWWERSQSKFRPLSRERLAWVEEQFEALVASPSRGKLLEGIRRFEHDDARFFAEKLLGEETGTGSERSEVPVPLSSSSLREKVVAALGLRQLVGTPLVTDVPRDARPKLVQIVSQNWLAWYEAGQDRLQPSLAAKTWAIVADTQYAHM
ncbi:MAG: hypothetical protein ABR915_13705, partial [Thermoguttaceae bacterium]